MNTPKIICCLSSHEVLIHFVLFVQRNLNNAFAYDLVPSPSVITAALKAARRVNDYPTAVRIFEGETSTSAIETAFLLSDGRLEY